MAKSTDVYFCKKCKRNHYGKSEVYYRHDMKNLKPKRIYVKTGKFSKKGKK